MTAVTTVAPWTVLESAVSFADPWLRVRSDHVRTASGSEFGPYHVIEYPDWVTVVALSQDNFRLLLVREYRHGVRAVLSGLPGGLVDKADGALPADAARTAAARELWEETGYRGGQLEHLTTLHPNPSNQTNSAYCYLAAGVSRAGVPHSASDGEAQEVIEADLLGTLSALRDGTLALHAVHVAALWSAAARIAADRTGRFGPLPVRLGRFLSGQPYGAPDAVAPGLATVGG